MNKNKSCCRVCFEWFVNLPSHMKNKHNKQNIKSVTVADNINLKKNVPKKEKPKMNRKIPKLPKLPKLSITNEKGDKVLLKITIDLNTGYIKRPNDAQIGKMEKVDLKKYILGMSKESKLLQVEIEDNKEYIKIPTDAEMDMMEKIVLEQYLLDLFEESKNLQEELESKNPPLPNDILPNSTHVGLLKNKIVTNPLDKLASQNEIGPLYIWQLKMVFIMFKV